MHLGIPFFKEDKMQRRVHSPLYIKQLRSYSPLNHNAPAFLFPLGKGAGGLSLGVNP